MSDLKYALRTLARSPGFTVVAILSLALGIGANTTVFTLIHTVFFQAIPVPESDRVMFLFTLDSRNAAQTAALGLVPVSRPNFDDYRKRNTSFEELASMTPAPLNLSGGAEPEVINGLLVSGNFFDMLRLTPALGRTFLKEEDSTAATHPVAVLSHDFWRRSFGGSPEAVGQDVRLNGHTYTIIGVAPQGFRGLNIVGSTDVWIPRAMHRQALTGIVLDYYDSRRALTHQVAGRLRADVTREQADAEVKSIAKQLAEEFPRDNDGRGATLLEFNQSQLPPNLRALVTTAAAVLLTIAGLVLLIACANIASLLLARASSRQREIAVRLSLGAARRQLIRQLMVESVVLALAGGLAALLVARWGLDFLWSFRPPFFPENALDLQLQPAVLGFCFIVSLLTGLLFGVIPAIAGSSPNLIDALKARMGGSGNTRGGLRLRQVLVSGQVALSLIALIGTGLFLQSLGRLQNADPGFDVDHTLVMSINPGSQGYSPVASMAYLDRVIERVQSVPGVEAAGIASNPPMAGGFMRSTFVEGRKDGQDSSGSLVMTNMISPGYFEATRIALLQGRHFTLADREGSSAVAIINETMARRFWPAGEAMGKRFHFFGEDQKLVEVVGVARDAKYVNIGEDPIPFMYLPLAQRFVPAVTLHVRTSGEPDSLIAGVRNEVQAIDRDLPLNNVMTMRDGIHGSLWAARMGASLLGVFGGLALLLAATGIYGLMSYSVTQRSQEIGLRMALGAQRWDVLGMILAQCGTVVGAGIGIGIAGSLALGRAASSLLFGVSGADLTTFAAVASVLLAAALLASYIPARRGTRIDPVAALKQE